MQKVRLQACVAAKDLASSDAVCQALSAAAISDSDSTVRKAAFDSLARAHVSQLLQAEVTESLLTLLQYGLADTNEQVKGAATACLCALVQSCDIDEDLLWLWGTLPDQCDLAAVGSGECATATKALALLSKFLEANKPGMAGTFASCACACPACKREALEATKFLSDYMGMASWFCMPPCSKLRVAQLLHCKAVQRPLAVRADVARSVLEACFRADCLDACAFAHAASMAGIIPGPVRQLTATAAAFWECLVMHLSSKATQSGSLAACSAGGAAAAVRGGDARRYLDALDALVPEPTELCAVVMEHVERPDPECSTACSLLSIVRQCADFTDASVREAAVQLGNRLMTATLTMQCECPHLEPAASPYASKLWPARRLRAVMNSTL